MQTTKTLSCVTSCCSPEILLSSVGFRFVKGHLVLESLYDSLGQCSKCLILLLFLKVVFRFPQHFDNSIHKNDDGEEEERSDGGENGKTEKIAVGYWRTRPTAPFRRRFLVPLNAILLLLDLLFIKIKKSPSIREVKIEFCC